MRILRENFNAGWRVCSGYLPSAHLPEYNDSQWDEVTLPHDWSIAQDFDKTLAHGDQHAYLPNGYVIYRKTVEWHTAVDEGYSLEFDGAYRSADVYVNGIHLHKQFHGYLEFMVDCTPAVRTGRNVIVVQIDNTIEQTSRWYTGTGINRNVWLHRLPARHFCWQGVAIITQNTGTITVQAQTCGQGMVSARVLGPDGDEIASEVGACGQVITLRVAQPQFWSPEHPVLYRCALTLQDSTGIVLDRVEERFGFRSIGFSPESGFLVNGEKYLLRGVNLHEELGGLGTAVHADAIRQRYAILKSWGVNAVRLAHHPFSREWYDLADEMGLFVLTEAYDKWNGQYYGGQVRFESAWQRDLQTFVQGRRNHPSIFLWSAGNEVVDQQLAGADEYGVRQMRRMRDEFHRLDPSRLVTCALYPARDGGVIWSAPEYRSKRIAPMAREMDVVSVNYMAEFIASDHQSEPGMIFLVSEEHTSERGGRWRLFDQRVGCGCFFWGGFDYLGEASWPHKNWFRGLVDRAGFRKPVSYRVEAMWSDTPVARLAFSADNRRESIEWNDVPLEWEELVSHWNWPQGALCPAIVFTNCEVIELTLNERRIHRQTMHPEDQGQVVIPVAFEPGELLLTGFIGDKKVAEHRLQTAGEVVRIAMHEERYPEQSEAMAFIGLTAVDAQGVCNPFFNQTVLLQVEPPSMLLAVVNGDSASSQRFASDALLLHQGRGRAVVRLLGQENMRISLKWGESFLHEEQLDARSFGAVAEREGEGKSGIQS